MTTNSSDKNIALTYEQLGQIEEATTRLRNIENEIVIASRNLGIENKEVVKATKERMYQEELLAELTPRVADTKKELSDLQEIIAESKDSLNNLRKESENIYKDISDKNIGLDQRKTNIEILEKEYEEKKNEYARCAEKLTSDQLLVEKAKEAFLTATESVVWK